MVGKILNYGSINIDEFFTVSHICKSGETLSSNNYLVRAGGKGANQSVALAKAGSQVYHAGKIGADAEWIRNAMSGQGVDMSFTRLATDQNNGRAFIQVSQETGDNSIVLFPGTNGTYTVEDAAQVLSSFGPGDWIVQQNEISQGGDIMRLAASKGLSILFNPAPLTRGILETFPFDKVTVLVVNEHEADSLYRELGEELPVLEGVDIAKALFHHFETMQVLIMTLGSKGVVALFREASVIRTIVVPGKIVSVKDTTGAGDTFVGYFLAAFVRYEGKTFVERIESALEEGNLAASISVQREGSMTSVPTLAEVQQLQNL